MSCCIIGCPNSGPTPSKETTYHVFPHPEKGLAKITYPMRVPFQIKLEQKNISTQIP